VAVKGSPSSATPAATATAGLTYVKTMARDGPTSLISSRNTRNAHAVQIRPSAASEASTRPGGTRAGQDRIAAGAYTTAVRLRQAVVIGSTGTSASFRAAISGADA
jgi:hypothetical protein